MSVYKETTDLTAAQCVAGRGTPGLHENHPIEPAVRSIVERRESTAINTAGGWSPGGYVSPESFKHATPKG
jgi:hypothetical protein